MLVESKMTNNLKIEILSLYLRTVDMTLHNKRISSNSYCTTPLGLCLLKENNFCSSYNINDRTINTFSAGWYVDAPVTKWLHEFIFYYD